MLKHKTVPVAMVLFCCSLIFQIARAQADKQIELKSKFTGEGYSLCGSCSMPIKISSSVLLASKDEPGERINISGTVYKEDGVTPDSGITLFLYQTDAGGYYHRPKEDVFHPTIFGWLRTNKDGRYEVHTIKPAPEIATPDEPAHIHVHIFDKNMPEHFLHEFWFKGDNRIPKKDLDSFAKLGIFSPVVTLIKGADGILRGTRNFRIRPAAAWKYEKE